MPNLKLKEKVTIRATPEVILENIWMLGLSISTPNPMSDGKIVFTYAPWTGNPGDEPMRQDHNGGSMEKTLSVPLWSIAAVVPELAAAINAVLAAIPAVIEYIDANPPKVRLGETQTVIVP